MNTFKYRKAVAECKALRGDGKCPRKCGHWSLDGSGGQPFCKEAFAAEYSKRQE